MKAFQHGALDWSTSVSAIFFNHSNNILPIKNTPYFGEATKRGIQLYILVLLL